MVQTLEHTLIRPSFDSIMLSFAVTISARATCARLHVGAVISSADFRQVYGIGYNGNACGFDNKCDSETPGACGCLHAEDNAVINCVAPRSAAKKVFCTHLPCMMCAKRLINLGGVQSVLYRQEYRDTGALAIFERAGIDVSRQ